MCCNFLRLLNRDVVLNMALFTLGTVLISSGVVIPPF